MRPSVLCSAPICRYRHLSRIDPEQVSEHPERFFVAEIVREHIFEMYQKEARAPAGEIRWICWKSGRTYRCCHAEWAGAIGCACNRKGFFYCLTNTPSRLCRPLSSLPLPSPSQVPYCTTVRVLKHSERPGMKDVIKLQISVERETQKGILIGAGGAALKALMSKSRKAVEEFLEREVFLECQVVVNDNWREDDVRGCPSLRTAAEGPEERRESGGKDGRLFICGVLAIAFLRCSRDAGAAQQRSSAARGALLRAMCEVRRAFFSNPALTFTFPPAQTLVESFGIAEASTIF